MEQEEDRLEIGKSKGRKLLAAARGLGWDLKEFYVSEEEEIFELDLWNSDTGEIISVAWESGNWLPPGYYEYQGRKIQIKNASAAKKRMAQQPDIVAPRRVRADGDGWQAAGAGRIIARSVPFDPENTNEDELRRLLAGKKIVWLNSTDPRILEEAHVPAARAKTDRRSAAPPGGKLFKISNGEAGRPIVSFADPHTTGFRHVALESILQVK
jgi:hypothetical protein